jgi:hypothetical protein
VPPGDRDLPPLICDRACDADGALSYPSESTVPGACDEFMAGLFGDVITGHRGRYMAHCHNLEHEDMAMMANLDVV